MPVLAAAFVPSAPLLVPELAGAAAAELDRLRAAADRAVAEVCAADRLPVVVVGAGTEARSYQGTVAATFRPWGVDVPVGDRTRSLTDGLPLALTVGGWLLDRAGVALSRRTYQEVAATGVPPAPSEPCVLLVVGDGSATRTPKAPGALHPDAQAYDAEVAAALAAGDPGALAALDAARADAVGATGPAAWRTAAQWWGPEHPSTAHVYADEAPFGVGYVVGVWVRSGDMPR